MKRHKWLLTLLLAVFLLGGGAFLLWQTGFFSSVGSLEEDAKLYRTLCALFPPVLFPDSTALGGDRTHSQQRDGAGWGGALWNVALIPDDLVGSGGRFRPCVLAGPCTGAAVCGAAGQPTGGGQVPGGYTQEAGYLFDPCLSLSLFPGRPDLHSGGADRHPAAPLFPDRTAHTALGLLVACALGGSVLTIPVWAMLLLGAAGVAVFAVCLKYGDRWEAALLERFKR
mgnify:CR=1 FL=1